MKIPRLKASEWLVIFLALVMAAGATWFYFSGESLLTLEGENGSERVGVLGESKGTVRRELLGASVFEAIDSSMPLYNEDTIVTAADSSARLDLDDGSTIELGPNAMIRLQYESEFSLTGIHRVPKVDVVAGQVTGRAKNRELRIRSGEKVVSIAKQTTRTLAPPVWKKSETPTPTPVQVAAVSSPTPPPPPPPPPEKFVEVTLLAPKTGARLRVAPGSASPSITATFEWRVMPADSEVMMVLRGEEDDADAEPVVRQRFGAAPSGAGSFSWRFSKPGRYVWELAPVDAKIKKPETALARFQIEPSFEGIRLLAPLVAGQARASNRLREKVVKNFDITLRWDPYPGARKYRVELAKAANGKPLMVREVETPSISLNRDKVFTGEVYYRVSTETPNGFRVLSPARPFRFQFLAPAPALPSNGAVLRLDRRRKVLLTWQKTNFTEEYELEIARDGEFRSVLFRNTTRENFHVLENPEPGDYFWRVKAVSGQVSSEMSEPMKFSVAAAPAPAGTKGKLTK